MELEEYCLQWHENNIIEDLKFTDKKPVVKYGSEAWDFANKHKKRIKINKDTNGVFLYEELPKDYEETGVVCILKYSVGTLAHELCHAKQFQENNKWLKRNLIKDILYMFIYYYYPPEREAFNYAEEYLEKYGSGDELKEYQRKTKYNAITSLCKIFIVLGLFLLIIFIVYIIINNF